MSRLPGDSYTACFCTSDFTTGASTNADSLPVAKANRGGGDDNGFTLAVANLDTGRYRISGSIPNSYAAGDNVNISVTATVNGVTDKAIVDAFVLDSARWATILGHQIPLIDAGAVGGLTLVLATSVNTPGLLSGTTPYCTSAQFVQRWDTRSVGRLLSDTNTALTSTEVLASTLLAELLKEASGEVELGCFRGERYSIDDLVALVGTNAGKKLAGLVADLTMWRLYDRRPDREGTVPPRCEAALKVLEQLADGELIFGLVNQGRAGVMSHRVLSGTDVRIRNNRIVQQRRYMGVRSDEDNDGQQAPA